MSDRLVFTGQNSDSVTPRCGVHSLALTYLPISNGPLGPGGSFQESAP